MGLILSYSTWPFLASFSPCQTPVTDNSLHPSLPTLPYFFYHLLFFCPLLYFYLTIDKFRLFWTLWIFQSILYWDQSNRRPAEKLIKQMLFHRRGVCVCVLLLLGRRRYKYFYNNYFCPWEMRYHLWNFKNTYKMCEESSHKDTCSEIMK